VVNTGGANEGVAIGGKTINGTTTGTPTNFSWNSKPSFTEQASDIKTTWVASNAFVGFDYQSFTLTDPFNVTTTDQEILLDMQGNTDDPLDPFEWASSIGAQPCF